MNRQITILNELEATAPALAKAIIALPYQIPNEYFQNFATILLSKLVNNKFISHQNHTTFFPNNFSTQTPYLAPYGYFENLENRILRTIKTLDEKEKIIIFFINSLPKTNPYQVPTGYFNHFANTLTGKAWLSEDLILESYPRTISYKIPNQYFEDLSNNILKNISLLESNDDSYTINLPKTVPYQIPSGYFDGLANKILDSLKQSNKSVPQGYFDSLSALLLHKVKQSDVENELAEIAPLLNNISRHNINQVPIGYFGKLESYSPEKTTVFEKQGAITISIKHTSQSYWFKNAIAACLIGTLGFTAYKLLDQPTRTNEAIAPYIQPKILLANIDVDKELSKLDDTTIAMYLDNDTFTESTAVDFQEVKDDNVDQVLQKIPDADLQQHLNEIEEPSKKRK